ncbi:MAG TPA: peptidoglycan-binding protein [Fibrobacteria bacterium]|nr:peptidoglycan-binding protein [Fibrobacteria bacterium]
MTQGSRATNPTGPSLLDKSTAHPGSIDKSIFEKKSGGAAGSAVGQGTVNPNYLKECREDNPEPTAQDAQTGSVVLSNCRITTPPDKLVVEQPFEMSVEAKASAGSASGEVSFRLFCTIPTENGQTSTEDQSLTLSGKVSEGVAKASGKLVSPKKPVAAGTKLQYHVVAQHPGAKEKCESPKVEVVSGKPPQPLAVWTLGAVHFGFGSSFVLPTAADQVAELKKAVEANPGAAVAVFGHADPVGDDEANKRLSGRRAHALYCLLTRQTEGWQELSKGVDGDKWDLRATQTILAHLKDGSGAPFYKGAVDGKNGPATEGAIKAFQKANGLKDDGIAGPKTNEKLYRSYMDGICEVACKPEDFVGDPKDAKRQWACVGCGEFNPVLVFDKSQEEAFAKSSDKTERNAKNAPNRRATVFLFPPGAKGPGNVEFPCPQWSEGIAKCKEQLFPDADVRRNPSNKERTWENDKDTFACRFYADVGKSEGAAGGSGAIESGDWKIEFTAAKDRFAGLAKKFREAEFVLWCSNLFGSDLKTSSILALRTDLLADKLPPCACKVTTDDLDGHEAGYKAPASPQQLPDASIHIAPALVQDAWEEKQSGFAAWKLYTLLIHEFGHHIDYLLRHHYETAAKPDADLDEGALFAYALIPMDAEKVKAHEVAVVEHAGERRTITAPLDKMSEAIEIYSGEHVQIRDEKNGLMEFFEAGTGHGRTCSWGHRSIEYEMAKAVGWEGADMDRSTPAAQLYFGNWLRDFSQVVDPKLLQFDNDISRTVLTNMVDLLAYREFYWDKKANAPRTDRTRGDFEVTPDRLGLYRPEEHIDNPCGIEATNKSDAFPDTGFRSACPDGSPELKPDPQTWICKYITQQVKPTRREQCPSTGYMESQIAKAFASKSDADFRRHLGGAFHTLEDIFAHSNFLELALRHECGKTKVPAWVAKDASINAYPLVTGSFGFMDTACSLIYTVGEIWESYRTAEDPEEKFRLHMLLAHFLIDDNVKSKNFAEQLKRASRIAFKLGNKQNASGEVQGASKKWLDWFHTYQKATEYLDYLNIYKHVEDLINSASEAYTKMKIQVLVLALTQAAKLIDDFQSVQSQGTQPGYPKIPTHSQLAKDHDDHPLHHLAATCASKMILRIGEAAMDFRKVGTPAAEASKAIVAMARGYFFHPAKWKEGTDAETLRRRKEIIELIQAWAASPANQSLLAKAEDQTWVANQYLKTKSDIEKIQKMWDKLVTGRASTAKVAMVERAQGCLECVA